MLAAAAAARTTLNRFCFIKYSKTCSIPVLICAFVHVPTAPQVVLSHPISVQRIRTHAATTTATDYAQAVLDYSWQSRALVG